MQAEIAFAGNGHAQSPVGEHLYADLASGRALDAFGIYYRPDFLYLMQVQFSCKHDDIRILRIETQRFGIRYAELGRNVYLDSDPACIHYGSHV